MPVDWSKYPPNWHESVTAVKLAAGWKCEKCGKQCRLPGDFFETHRRPLLAFIDMIKKPTHRKTGAPFGLSFLFLQFH